MEPKKFSDTLPAEQAHPAPYEAAARIYCERAGLDPDEITTVRHPLIAGASLTFRQWYHVAERMIDLSNMLTAMKRAKELSAISIPN